MMRLSLTVPLAPAETATSFASRLAARNGSIYVQDFVQDMELSWRSVVAGDATTLSVLAQLGNVDAETLTRHSFRSADGRRRTVGSETISPRFARHTRLRVCPLCMAQEGPVPPGSPVTWQIQAIGCCHVHDVTLVEVPAAVFPRTPLDIAGRVRDHRGLIDRAADRMEPAEISNCEQYIAARLIHGRSGHFWLDDWTLAAVWNACQMLGIVLSHGPAIRVEHLTAAERSAAAGIGFDRVSGGKAKLHETLRAIHDDAGIERGGFYTEFLPFARWLTKTQDSNDAVPLLDAVREFIEETYPVGPGEDILGRPCGVRRIHSVMTAAREHRINWTRMRRLVETIASTPGHEGLPAPNQHLWFDAQSWDPYLARYAGALNPKAAAKTLSVRPEFFTRMVEAGLISPVLSYDGLVDRYDPRDLHDLLDRLLKSSRPAEVLGADVVPILNAYPKCNVDAVTILGLILEGRLKLVGRREGTDGIPALAVCPREIVELLVHPRLGGYRHGELKRILGINSTTVSLLKKEGRLACVRRFDRRTGKPVLIVEQYALDALTREFVTLSQLATKMKTLPKHAAARLAAKGVVPIDLPIRCSKIYRRADIEAL